MLNKIPTRRNVRETDRREQALDPGVTEFKVWVYVLYCA